MRRRSSRFHGVLTTILGGLRRLVSPNLYCFISYRRNDVKSVAEQIRAVLKEDLFRDSFLDDRSLKPGEAWPREIRTNLARSDVVFVIIGPNWESGRLMQDDDVLRHELVAARRNRSIVTPVLVAVDAMPTTDELPPELEYLTRQEAGAPIPAAVSAETLRALVGDMARHPAKEARRRKLVARLVLVGVAAASYGSVWYVGQADGRCGTGGFDIGVAVRIDDRRPDGSAPGAPSAIADSLAEAFRTDVAGVPALAVLGPTACGELATYDAADTADRLATRADLEALISGDLVVNDQGSELALSMTFAPLAIPDAPEITGTHHIVAEPGGRDIGPGAVTGLVDDDLSDIADLVGAMQLHRSAQYEEAAAELARVTASLSDGDSTSLVRVMELLRGNSLLLHARALQAGDPELADETYELALAAYSGVAELDGVSYGRAYVGIGEVWVERCRADLAAAPSDPMVDSADVDAGLQAFDTAFDLAGRDEPSTAEMGLKASLGGGNLALCGLLAAAEPERRLALADRAERSFSRVVEGAADIENFAGLASEARVGLAVVELVRCDRRAPDPSMMSARELLQAALPSALPSRSSEITNAIGVLDQALDDGVVPTGARDSLSTSVTALIVAACGLPSG